jgi:hypothetical protein
MEGIIKAELRLTPELCLVKAAKSESVPNPDVENLSQSTVNSQQSTVNIFS